MFPVIGPGVDGAVPVKETSTVLAAEVPHEFEAATATFPPELPKLTTMEVVPCPETIVAPDGTVQA